MRKLPNARTDLNTTMRALLSYMPPKRVNVERSPSVNSAKTKVWNIASLSKRYLS